MDEAIHRHRSPMRIALVGLALVAALALVASAALATINGTNKPKKGAYEGATASGKPISLKVKKHKKVKVNFCGYSMSGHFRGNKSKFDVAHTGPGGVYVAVKGDFPDKETASGTIPTDFLCETEGEGWSATHK